MAIVVEEEKKQLNWVAILSTLFIIVVVFVGSYFLFFTKPELIEVVVPGQLKSLGDISTIDFNAEEMAESSIFKLLRRVEEAPTPPTAGKNNPFKPF